MPVHAGHGDQILPVGNADHENGLGCRSLLQRAIQPVAVDEVREVILGDFVCAWTGMARGIKAAGITPRIWPIPPCFRPDSAIVPTLAKTDQTS
jgi:hypothetical protein